MIKPTIGRVVWFWPSERFLEERRRFIYVGKPDPCAAIIAKVLTDDVVNLSVIDHEGNQHQVTSCPLRQDDQMFSPGVSYCEWMPYQKGQAAKTEEAERRAAVEVVVGLIGGFFNPKRPSARKLAKFIAMNVARFEGKPRLVQFINPTYGAAAALHGTERTESRSLL